MTIGINGNEANVPHRVGIGQYSFELLRHLSVLGANFSVYLKDEPLADMPPESDTWKYKVFGPRKLWMLTGLQKKIISEKIHGKAPNVFFTSTHYSPPLMPVPTVISIMDLAFEKFPKYFKKRDYYQLKYWTRFSAIQAKKIITISQNSKQDIIDIYHVPPGKVVVTYPGYDQTRFHPGIKGKNKYGDYILFLGTLQPRKNIERLVEAFKLLKTNCKLVIVGMRNEGRGGWMNDNIRASENVILTGYVPDSEVPVLMANARAYVLPSLYEGFGIPAIEAMACGTPVIVSRVSSLPEICGDAATYIEDPYDVLSIKAALEQGLKSDKTKLGLELVKRYNWEDTAKKTLDVCLEISTVKN